MKVEYINPFLTSTIAVFDTMLQCKLVRATPYLKHGAQPQHEVSGVIGLSGRAQGTVVLGLSREAALGAAEVLLQERPAEINGDVWSASFLGRKESEMHGAKLNCASRSCNF